MVFLDIIVTSGLDPITMEQVMALLQTIDSDMIADAVDKLFGWFLMINATVGSLYLIIKNRYNKAKLVLKEKNYMEATKVEKAEMLADETKQIVAEAFGALKDTLIATKDEVAGLKEDYKVVSELLVSYQKYGTLSQEGLMEVGAVMERAKDKTQVISEEFIKAYDEATTKSDDTTSILDK